MFTQIMVPLDGSALAERALPSARRLAATAGATLHLVRAIEPPPAPARLYSPINLYNTYMAEEIRTAGAYLDAARDRLAADGVAVEVRVLTGGPLYALPHYERSAGIDLVVMCSHGRSGPVRFALGSVADHLLRHGAAPVLLVRAFGDPVALDHALVPLDGSARAEEALRLVERLAGRVLHDVTLLRVIDAPAQGPEAERYLEQAARALQGTPVACTRRVEQGDAAERIIATAGQDKLVVMTTRARGDLLRWVLGSVADRVARDGATAVLLVQAGTTDIRQEQGVAQGQEESNRQRVTSLLLGTGG
jgi:nucleotide-binding universal stress UspA family protein